MDDDRTPRWLVFSGGAPMLRVHKLITNVTLKGSPSSAVPGATLSLKIVTSNVGVASARAHLVYAPVPANTTYATQFTSAGWSTEWSTNAAPVQAWGSSSYGGTQPAAGRVRWIRWKRTSLDPGETATCGYSVIVK
jgi:hypothetical protein